MNINDYKYERCKRCGTSMQTKKVIIDFGGIIERDLMIIVCPWCRTGDDVYRQNKSYRSMERFKRKIRKQRAKEKQMSMF